MISYNEEDYFEALPELKTLFEANHDETGTYPERTLNPDYDIYDLLAEAGLLPVFTIRDDEELVGYGIFMLANSHTYYAGMRHASSDVIYVKPEYRGAVAAEFITYMDERLVEDHEVEGITFQVKVSRDFSPLLHTLGYKTSSLVCNKDLG